MKTSPPRRFRPTSALLVLPLCVAVTLSACGDGTTPPPTDGEAPADTLRVLVVDRDSSAPRAGIKLVLMDPDNRIAAGPAATGQDGEVVFELDPPPALAHLIAFTGDHHLVNEMPPPLAWPHPGSPTATITVGTRVQPGTLPRLAGMVTDAATGEPLAGVFVSLSPYLGGYLGRTDPSDDVTLTDGLFRVSNIPFAADPFSGNLSQIMPLILNREGYLPATYVHPMRPGDDNLDITDIVVALEPDLGGTGALAGVVMFGREPVADLPIGLGSLGSEGGKAAVGQPGRTATTDHDGRFVFEDLPSGGYLLQPGYRPDDGWLMPNQPAARLYTVVGEQTTVADTLQVVRAITPLEPLGHQATTPDRFAWQAVAEADSYTVYLGGVRIGRTHQPMLEGVDLSGLAPGWHLWNVSATTTSAAVVGGSETFARFRMPLPKPLE